MNDHEDDHGDDNDAPLARLSRPDVANLLRKPTIDAIFEYFFLDEDVPYEPLDKFFNSTIIEARKACGVEDESLQRVDVSEQGKGRLGVGEVAARLAENKKLGRSVGRSVGRLVGRSVGRSISQSICLSVCRK